jgi:hypothetical protein
MSSYLKPGYKKTQIATGMPVKKENSREKDVQIFFQAVVYPGWRS